MVGPVADVSDDGKGAPCVRENPSNSRPDAACFIEQSYGSNAGMNILNSLLGQRTGTVIYQKNVYLDILYLDIRRAEAGATREAREEAIRVAIWPRITEPRNDPSRYPSGSLSNS